MSTRRSSRPPACSSGLFGCSDASRPCWPRLHSDDGTDVGDAPNRLPEIARLAELVDAFGKAHGLSSEVIFNLNLSLDEVLTNVIVYAFDDDAAHDVAVRVMLDDDRVCAEVEDDGCAFGVYLVRSLMDMAEYRRERERSVFTMSKRHAG